MNHSLVTADRTTHAKIIGVALAAAMGVFTVGWFSGVESEAVASRADSRPMVVKANQPAVITDSGASTIR